MAYFYPSNHPENLGNYQYNDQYYYNYNHDVSNQDPRYVQYSDSEFYGNAYQQSLTPSLVGYHYSNYSQSESVLTKKSGSFGESGNYYDLVSTEYVISCDNFTPAEAIVEADGKDPNPNPNWNPKPFHGGYDIHEQYGKPLSPSMDICYPSSKIDPSSNNNTGGFSYGSVPSPYVEGVKNGVVVPKQTNGIVSGNVIQEEDLSDFEDDDDEEDDDGEYDEEDDDDDDDDDDEEEEENNPVFEGGKKQDDSGNKEPSKRNKTVTFSDDVHTIVEKKDTDGEVLSKNGSVVGDEVIQEVSTNGSVVGDEVIQEVSKNGSVVGDEVIQEAPKNGVIQEASQNGGVVGDEVIQEVAENGSDVNGDEVIQEVSKNGGVFGGEVIQEGVGNGEIRRQIPSGYGMEAIDLCEGVLGGYFPCLWKRNQRIYNHERDVNDKMSDYDYCWKETAEYLFGNPNPYGGAMPEKGSYGDPVYNYHKHYPQQPLTEQVEYHGGGSSSRVHHHSRNITG
ncbi:hypothetical protein SOVF_166140 [Spinacia oleracea]|nr:hypothetical protein SOVF_166140 [Spinacia oleracea]